MGAEASKDSSKFISKPRNPQAGPKPEYTTFTKFQAFHTHIKTYEDARYGKVSIFKAHNQPKYFLVKEKWTTTQDEAENTRKVINSMLNDNSNDNIEPIRVVGEEVEKSFCSQFNRFFVAWDYNGWTLNRKINKWSKKRTADGKRKMVTKSIFPFEFFFVSKEF
jgi:hypothetical protein